MTWSRAPWSRPRMDCIVVRRRNSATAGSAGAAGAVMTRLLFVTSTVDERRGVGRDRATLRARAEKTKTPARVVPAGVAARIGGSKPFRVPSEIAASAREDPIELLLDLHFLRLRRDGDLLDEERARRVEHLPLAERQLLVALETLQVTEHLGDLE